MTSILVAGDVTYNGLIHVDHFPEPKSQTVFSKGFHETVGGTAAGKALNLARLGLDVTLHGLIGDDAPGRAIQEFIAREKLTLITDRDPKGTQRHINLMDNDGGRISYYVVYATFEPELDLARLESLISQSDIVVLNLSNYCRRLIPLAKQHGKPIWVDIHDYDGKNEYHRDFIEGADVLTMNSTLLGDQYKQFMEHLISAGKQLVVCTHGDEGSTALTPQGEWIETPAITTYPQVDTNGAGDAFFSGLLYGHTRGYSVERGLRFGAITSGLCITSRELFDTDLSPAKAEAEYNRLFGEND